MPGMPENFRYQINELNGHYYLTSPDDRTLLVAKRSREAAIAALPEAVRRFRFHQTRVWGPIPDLRIIEV